MTADEVFRRARDAHAGGDHAAAERLAREVLLADPDHADALSLLGLLMVRAGDRTGALPHWQRAATLRPGIAAHRYNLAELLRQLGRPGEAEAEFRAAVELAPSWAEAVFGLANALKDQGRTADALAAYTQAISLQPRFARALYNRGNMLREQGRVAEAERDYRRALDADPNLTDALVNLGAALGELHRWAEAEDCYRRALTHQPNDLDLGASLAGAVLAQGRTAEAADLLAACEARAADPAVARLRRQTLLPPIPESSTSIAANRAQLAEVLERARHNPPSLDPARLHHAGLEPPMALAYHADDPRPLLEAYAALYAPQIEPLELLPAIDGRPRVGVVVTHGHEGVYDRCLGRLVERIAAGGRIHVTLVCSPAGANILRHLRPSFAGEYLTLPTRVDEAAVRIRDARFDVLHYWEAGTDATNYFLPYFRPARVQCATWGWPVTTGNPRIDWYVSADALEPPDGDAHYTERLARLASLATCYERPPAPPPPADPAARRRAFGVDARTPVYLCVQNLRKFHPDFDGVLAALLARDSRGRVVLVGDEQAGITDTLMRRLRRALGPDARRIGVVSRQDRSGYLRLVSSADVLLDTLHYGSGANTVADAVACGTPLVTLPGQFHRGRWAAAVLRQAGLNELVVGSTAEYVEAAVLLANDETHRRRVSDALRAFGTEWFDDPRPAAELEALWLEQSNREP
jgi:predicted O-linked N-acetylglucosamine transferase (SPINDLY family)